MTTIDAASRLRIQLDETLEVIESRTAFKPQIGLIVGSGLGGVTRALKIEAEIDYAELPHMPSATAPGHESKLVLGTLGQQRMAILANGKVAYQESLEDAGTEAIRDAYMRHTGVAP